MAVRQPAVAGQFYSDNPAELRKTVSDFIKQSDVEPAPQRVAAIVAPHAGYMFSGLTAAHAFARVQDKHPQRIILMGCSHRYPIRTASVVTEGSFETPLGSFPVDESFAREFGERARAEGPEPHVPEHCLEVMLPFVKVTMGKVPIVPVLFSAPATDYHYALAQTLAEMTSEEDLVIASTDLSHYLSGKQANTVDQVTLNAVLSQDFRDVAKGCRTDKYSMCGSTAVVVAMAYALAQGTVDWTLRDYRTSGDAVGDYSQVVGYAAITMERR